MQQWLTLGGNIDKILDSVKQLGGTVKKILLTHGHLDHCAAAKDLSDQLGAPIEGPQLDEQFWLDQLPEQSVRFGFGHAKAFVPTRWLEDGDHVQFVPGHGQMSTFGKERQTNPYVGD